MKVSVDVECTPQEARSFLGLPDVAPLNDQVVAELQKRMKDNMAALQPDELMKNWMTLGGQAQEHFRRLMTAAATGATSGLKP